MFKDKLIHDLNGDLARLAAILDILKRVDRDKRCCLGQNDLEKIISDAKKTANSFEQKITDYSKMILLTIE